MAAACLQTAGTRYSLPLSGSGRNSRHCQLTRLAETLTQYRTPSAADDWILLGQFDTDGQAQFMWGEGGVLYYLIRPADLAARQFDQTVFTWQCS